MGGGGKEGYGRRGGGEGRRVDVGKQGRKGKLGKEAKRRCKQGGEKDAGNIGASRRKGRATRVGSINLLPIGK